MWVRLKYSFVALGLLVVILLVSSCYRVTHPTAMRHAVKDLPSPEGAPVESPFIIKIGAYNIAHGRGAETSKSNHAGGSKQERIRRLDQIASLIKAQGLDMIILNEVDFNCTWSHGVNQAKYLAEKAGFPYYSTQQNVDVAVPFYRVSIGNALLSKYPITDTKIIEFPALNWKEDYLSGHKNGSFVDVDHPLAGTLRVFPIHLESRSKENRVESLERLLPHKSDSSIWAGDFNAESGPDSVVTKLLRETGGQVTANPLPTFPTANPKRTLDWVVVPSGWREEAHRVITDSYSDHALVISQWRLPAQPKSEN